MIHFRTECAAVSTQLREEYVKEQTCAEMNIFIIVSRIYLLTCKFYCKLVIFQPRNFCIPNNPTDYLRSSTYLLVSF